MVGLSVAIARLQRPSSVKHHFPLRGRRCRQASKAHQRQAPLPFTGKVLPHDLKGLAAPSATSLCREGATARLQRPSSAKHHLPLTGNALPPGLKGPAAPSVTFLCREGAAARPRRPSGVKRQFPLQGRPQRPSGAKRSSPHGEGAAARP